jgi:hypothetical protein
VYAGLHYQSAVDVAPRCAEIGDAVYTWAQRLINGTEPVRPSSKGRPVSDIGWLYRGGGGGGSDGGGGGDGDEGDGTSGGKGKGTGGGKKGGRGPK